MGRREIQFHHLKKEKVEGSGEEKRQK